MRQKKPKTDESDFLGFHDPGDTSGEFNDYYNRTIRQHFEELETRRQFFLKQFYSRRLIFILAAIATFTLIFLCKGDRPFASGYHTFLTTISTFNMHYIEWYHSLDSWLMYILPSHMTVWTVSPLTTLGLLVFVGGSIWTCIPIFQYRLSIKETVFHDIFAFFGDFTYQPQGSVDVNYLYYSGLLPDEYDIYESEDYVTGKQQDCTIELCEAKLLQERHPPVSFFGLYEWRRTETIFNGLFISLDMTDIFGHTIIDGDLVILENSRRQLSPIPAEVDNLPIQLECSQTQSSQHFSVYTDNKEAVSALLTDEVYASLLKLAYIVNAAQERDYSIDEQIMNWLRGKEKLAIADKYRFMVPNKSIQLTIREGRVFISIPCRRDLFEPRSLFASPVSGEDMAIILETMRAIISIIRIICRNKARNTT